MPPRHFSEVSTRAFAGLIKAVVTSFMKRNQLPLPDESSSETSEVLNIEGDDTNAASSLVKSSSEASSCQMYDRLIFLAVPLAVVIKDESCLSSRSQVDACASPFEGNIKPQVLAENALQEMVRV